MGDNFDYEMFFKLCKNITNDIIDIYDELLKLELRGNHNSQEYNCMVLKLKEKIEEEKKLYVYAYNLMGDDWDDLELKARQFLFGKYDKKPNCLWFVEQDAMTKNLDFKLERRIFGNIYVNVYSFLDELLENEDEIEEEVEENFFDDSGDIVDLTLCDEIKDDYLIIFKYLLNEYLNRNGKNLSLNVYKELIEFQYDLAFTTNRYEQEFIDNNFSYPDKMILHAEMNAEMKAYERAMASVEDNKQALFLKYLKVYKQLLNETSIVDVEEQLKRLEEIIEYNDAVKIINFLYLKAILCSGYQKRDFDIDVLNSHKGISDNVNQLIDELLNYKILDGKIYKLSLHKK